jgi:hypothetical protein
MNKGQNERGLVWTLRVFGLWLSFGVIGVFMPWAWMVEAHLWCGLGPLAASPLVEFMARALSAFYLFAGLFLILLSFDPAGFRPLIRFASGAGLALCLLLFAVHLKAGLPACLVWIEGPVATLGSLSIGFLSWKSQGRRQ